MQKPIIESFLLVDINRSMEGVVRHRKRQQAELEQMRRKKKKNLKSHGAVSSPSIEASKGEELEEGEVIMDAPSLSLAVGSFGSTETEVEDKSIAVDASREGSSEGGGGGADELARDKFVELFGKELRFQCEVNSDSNELKGARYLTPQVILFVLSIFFGYVCLLQIDMGVPR